MTPVAPDAAPAALKSTFDAITAAVGRVPNLYGIMGHSPATLSGLLGFEAALDAKGRLSHREVELIALRMAQLNGCGYCLSAHVLFSQKAGLSADEVDAARGGLARAPRERALLDFVTRVVRTGGSGAAGELDQLRVHGLGDEEAIEIVARVALFGMANAIGVMAHPIIDWPEAPRLPRHGDQ
jgi:uncharacterized peroxidase-related enzyme